MNPETVCAMIWAIRSDRSRRLALSSCLEPDDSSKRFSIIVKVSLSCEIERVNPETVCAMIWAIRSDRSRRLTMSGLAVLGTWLTSGTCRSKDFHSQSEGMEFEKSLSETME